MTRPIGTLGFVLALAAATTLGADAASASSLTKHGTKALNAKQIKKAKSDFMAALKKQKGYVPALLGLAKVFKARHEEKQEISFLVQCLERADHAHLPSEQRVAADEAGRMLRSVDPALAGYRRMVRPYVSKLEKLIHQCGKKDLDLVHRCVLRILRVDPHDPLALKLAKEHGWKITHSGPAPRETPIFDGKDLIGWFGIGPEDSVKDGVLTVTAQSDTYFDYYTHAFQGNYSVVWEMRVTENTGKYPLVLLEFATRSKFVFYGVSIFAKAFMIRHSTAQNQVKSLRRAGFDEIKGGVDLSKWNRYEVRVKAGRATFLLNGKEILHYDAPQKGAFDGMAGFLVQDCITEFRKIALVAH